MLYVIALLAAILFPVNAAYADFNSQYFTLKNGMQVVLIANHKVPAVNHMVWYKVGRIDEPYGKSGLAHFLEHLMFKGTTKFKKGEFSRQVALNGGNDNAFTSQDYTAYFQHIPKEKLAMVMEMEADRMKNLVLGVEDVVTERKVILEERRSRVDNNPVQLLIEQMNASMFLNHPYGTPLIGWQEEIEELQYDDVIEFYKKHYDPTNAILVVSGDVTLEELKPMAEKYYGAIASNGSSERKFYYEPDHIAEQSIILKHHAVSRPSLLRFYIAPSYNFGERSHVLPLELLAQIVGKGNTGRIYKELVIDKKIATDVSVNYDSLSLGPGVFSINVSPVDDVALIDLENALDSVLEKIVLEGFNEDELEIAKIKLSSETIYSRDGFKTAGYIFGQALAANLQIDDIENWSDRIMQIQSDRVLYAARHIFKPNKSVTGFLQSNK